MYKFNYEGTLLWVKIIGNPSGSSQKPEAYMEFAIDSSGYIYTKNRYYGNQIVRLDGQHSELYKKVLKSRWLTPILDKVSLIGSGMEVERSRTLTRYCRTYSIYRNMSKEAAEILRIRHVKSNPINIGMSLLLTAIECKFV